MLRNAVIQIRVSPDERERWEAAAKGCGLDLSTWLRGKADSGLPGVAPAALPSVEDVASGRVYLTSSEVQPNFKKGLK